MFRMMRWLVIAALLPAFRPAEAAAQDYSFSVPEMKMRVVVNKDASTRTVYDITFRNNPAGHAIDIVDIGTPDRNYSLKNVKASVGETPLRDIRKSTVVDPGFEVHLGRETIPPGGEGTLHVEFTMPDRVYQDTTRDDYASLRITPTWWDGRYVTGTTHLQIAVQLPASVKPDEVLYQDAKQKFTQKAQTDHGALVGWDFPKTRMDGPHLVGLSFPKRDMERVVVKTKLDMLLEWFGGSTEARVVAGLIFAGLFGFLFFRFSGGTGVSVFVVLLAGAIVLFVVSPGIHLLSLPVVVVLVGLNEWMLRRRRVGYMPPIAQVEGGGIKRGLSAPEAAALLELPIARVLGLVIFGMLKKGLVRQVEADPLAVEVDPDFKLSDGHESDKAGDRDKFYRRAGQQRGVVVHKYEQPFLFLLQSNPGMPVRRINFALPMRKLLERVAARMRGFDVSDTQDYYRAIVRRAVSQAAAVGDVEQREKSIDRDFEWILMDDDYPTVFTYGRPYRPIWVRGTTLSGGGPPAGGAPAAPSAPSAGGRPSFGDVSASFAGWAENTMGGLASAVAPGSLSVPGPSGGFLDLSGADHATGQFFQALAEAAESSGGGGGGGGGCACACAGCACACACAGGGR